MARVTAYEVDFRSGKVTYEPARPDLSPPPMHSYEDLLAPLPEELRQPFREQWERHISGGEPVSMEYQAIENGVPPHAETVSNGVAGDRDGLHVGQCGSGALRNATDITASCLLRTRQAAAP